jgi:L-ribulose-5-phosphate 4-epimerase
LNNWLNEKKMVLAAALKLEEKGLIVGTSGNVSLRLPPVNGKELLVITPTSRHYDLLGPGDIPVIDFEARPVEGDLQPSSESMLHISLYRARKDIHAIIHTHSVYASALAVAHLEIPPVLDDQVAVTGGEIKVAAYAASGSDQLVTNVLVAMEDRNAALMMNHGAVGAGRNLREALTVCEIIEKTARAYYLCLTMGKVNLLSEEAVQAGKAVFRLHQRGG